MSQAWNEPTPEPPFHPEPPQQLKSYCDSRRYVMIDQRTVNDMNRFYASWKDAKRARAKKLEHLKAFIKFCLKRE